ncbi:MAG: hypothetical protein EU549_00160 [Promethearchaeota archaeon]|nr:MAG: hypothetical protein EU549_00160 [Candidatus Lokiarchaeota archaeon]
MSEESNKIKIDIKALETPAGPVPTIEAIKEIIKGLNILNDEMIKNKDTINDEVIKMLESVERELKTLKKLLAEETISFSALKESVSSIDEKIEKRKKEEKNDFNEMKKSIDELNHNIKSFEVNLEAKIYSILKKIIKPKSTS